MQLKTIQLPQNISVLALLFLIISCEAVFTCLIPLTRGHLFSLLSIKQGAIWLALFFYFLNYFAVDLFQSIKGYVVLKVALWYRVLRTKGIFDKNMDKVTNLPQRIQEDIKLSYVSRITVWCEYFISGAILVFLIVLNINLPILIGLACVYAVISVYIAMKFNPRLTSAEIDSQQAEASYRTSLVNCITDLTLLPGANAASTKAMRIQTEYLLFTKLQLGLVTILPYVVLIPELMDGKIDLGVLVEHQSIFALIVVNAGILIQLYTTLIKGRASDYRVKEITNEHTRKES